MAVVTMKNLLEAGVHFGHQTNRWDPRMRRFIFSERNGIHIIDLQKTIVAIKEAYNMVRKTVLQEKSVLFVGTKKQAQGAIKREAERCGMFYVSHRWLGGTLTNLSTIRKSLFRLKRLEKMETDGSFSQMSKKEVSRLSSEKARLEKNLGGIRDMDKLPGVVFILDPKREAIAVAEAGRAGIPIVAVVDTNCNPEVIDHPIPGNDDAIRAIGLFTQVIANAVVEADNEIGLEVIENLQETGAPSSEEKTTSEESSRENLSDESASAPSPQKETPSQDKPSVPPPLPEETSSQDKPPAPSPPEETSSQDKPPAPSPPEETSSQDKPPAPSPQKETSSQDKPSAPPLPEEMSSQDKPSAPSPKQSITSAKKGENLASEKTREETDSPPHASIKEEQE